MTELDPIAGGPAERTVQPGSDARGLALAGALASLAGMVDAIGYLRLGGLFVSFMSGNSTELGTALGQGDLAQAGIIAELIALFVVGAAAGQIVSGVAGRWRTAWVLAGVAALLAIAAAGGAVPEPMVLAMGALNASLHRVGHIPVGLTYVTGGLVRLGQGLGDFITRRSKGWIWLAQASPFAGLIAGATLGAGGFMLIGERVIWAAVGLASVLAALTAAGPQPE